MSDDISIPSPTYRVPRRQGMDPATKRLALIAAGLCGAFVVILGGWSLLGSHSGGVPVVEAASGPVRVKPANPGGLQVAGVGNDIFSGGSDTNVDKLAPPPEVPNPQALRAPPPPPKVAELPAPPAAAPSSAASPPPTTARVFATPAASQAQAAAQPVRPQPVSAHDQASRPAQDRALARDQATGSPAATTRGAGHGTSVQLAALSSEDAAKTEWRNLSRRLPELLGSRQPMFSRVEHGGHVFWRVRTGGFGDLAQARDFCGRLRGRGLACSVADF